MAKRDAVDAEKSTPAKSAAGDRAAGERTAPERVLDLQSAAGNRSTRAALAALGAQAKLELGAVDDPHEHEADAVAAQVLRSLGRAPVQRHDAPPATTKRAPARHGPHGGAVDPDVARTIESARAGGRTLDRETRATMEGAFGADFGAVRVHDDHQADALNQSLNATAFTTGRDIFFRRGAYDPRSQGGRELLAHELTHTVQQGAAPGVGPSLATDGVGGRIQRHASKEHYILGAMTPKQIKAIGAGKEVKERDPGVVQKAVQKIQGQSVKLTPAERTELAEALQAIDEQLAGLDQWRTIAPPTASFPSGQTYPPQVPVGDNPEEVNHAWGNQLLTVPCRDGKLACTVADMNALPDFFGSYDDLARADRSVVHKVFQVIRRETYIYLNQLKGQLGSLLGPATGEYKFDRKTEDFAGIEDNNISLPSIGPKVVDDIADVGASTALTKGAKGETGVETAIAADATLGRNACHFPPESWLRWKDSHLEARKLINGATTVDELNEVAHEAIGRNAFGEHYLQDSYAGGHLINKGFVMAVALDHLAVFKTIGTNYFNKEIRGQLQDATAHRDAYALPSLAHARKPNLPAAMAGMDPIRDARARDPQSALDAASKAAGPKGATKQQQKQQKKVAQKEELKASGLENTDVTFEQFRAFLNDLWLQKITNTLHDKYCVKGLMVGSPHRKALFKVYGDNAMMNSKEGAEYTAETSQMSRNAINQAVKCRRAVLLAKSGKPPGPPVAPPVPMERIFARFPDRVKDEGGPEMPLVEWATGEPMRKQIKELVNFFGADDKWWKPSAERWKEGKLTGVVRPLSAIKTVSPGLTAKHGPPF